jgi:hypothetical protein
MIKSVRGIAVGIAVVVAAILVPPPDVAAASTLPACTQTAPQAYSGISVRDANNYNEIFWVGTSDETQPTIPGALWHKWQNADGSYSGAVSLGGYLTSPISGTKNADGRIEIFGQAAGGDLAHIWELAPNGSTGWSGWASLGGALFPGSGPEATQFLGDSGQYQIMVKVGGVDTYSHCKAQQSPNGNWTPNWY